MPMLYSNYYIIKCYTNKTPVNLEFLNWINRVELAIYTKYQTNLLDLPDEAYMINFEDGISSEEMVSKICGELENIMC